MAQIYTGSQGFVHVNPCTSKSLARLKLENLTENIGIPNTIIYDGDPKKVGPDSDFQKTMSKCKIRRHQWEPYSQCQNRAEDSILELKCGRKRHMIKCRSPTRVWGFGMVYEYYILYIISQRRDGTAGMERITGDTVDIRKWTYFEFYNLY